MPTHDTPRFLLLHDFTGDPLLLASDRIVQVTAEDWKNDRVHKELDPDCDCGECKDWWSITCITLDLPEPPCEHQPQGGWTEHRVRETVEQIAAMLSTVEAG